MGFVELCQSRWAAKAPRTDCAGAGDRRDDPGRRVHLAYAMMRIAGDVDVARSVYRHSMGVVDRRRRRRDAVAGRSNCSVAGDGRDGARRADFANAGVEPVGDVDVAGRIRRHVRRPLELRRGRRAAIAAEAARPIAGDGRRCSPATLTLRMR